MSLLHLFLSFQADVNDGHHIRDIDNTIDIHVGMRGIVLGQAQVDDTHDVCHVDHAIVIGITRKEVSRPTQNRPLFFRFLSQVSR